MEYLTRQTMQRRTFLKGAGVALLLPRLESLGQVEEAKSPRRLLTIVNHLSFYQPELIPQNDGGFVKPPPLLNQLSDHFDHLKIFSGLDNPAVQNGFGPTPCVGVLSGYFTKLHRQLPKRFGTTFAIKKNELQNKFAIFILIFGKLYFKFQGIFIFLIWTFFNA